MLCVVLVHSPCLQDRHSSLPVRYPQRPLQFISTFPSYSCILACWQVIFDDQPTRDPFSPQKKIYLQQFVRFLFFFFSISLIARCRMSKSSTATAPKIPTPLPAKSAWSRGPPQSSTAPSPRSQSPAPSTPVLQTHSRRPSALGQGIPIKDGVSIPRNNVSAVKQGLSPSFYPTCSFFHLLFQVQR